MMKRSKSPRSALIRKADALWQEAVCKEGKCLLCGRTKPLCGHHIKGKKARPDLRHVIANGVCVCWGFPGSCHDWMHTVGDETVMALLSSLMPKQMQELGEMMYEHRVVMLSDLEQMIERLKA